MGLKFRTVRKVQFLELLLIIIVFFNAFVVERLLQVIPLQMRVLTSTFCLALIRNCIEIALMKKFLVGMNLIGRNDLCQSTHEIILEQITTVIWMNWMARSYFKQECWSLSFPEPFLTELWNISLNQPCDPQECLKIRT